jgi:hypothetical protein
LPFRTNSRKCLAKSPSWSGAGSKLAVENKELNCVGTNLGALTARNTLKPKADILVLNQWFAFG